MPCPRARRDAREVRRRRETSPDTERKIPVRKNRYEKIVARVLLARETSMPPCCVRRSLLRDEEFTLEYTELMERVRARESEERISR